MGVTRLLIIDDNELLVEMMQEYFKKESDIQISLVAYDGKKGIYLIDNHLEEFDIILLDIVMPKKDGIDVLEHINQNHIEKQVIVITSYNTPEMIGKVASLGADYIILKPFELSDLKEKIYRVKEIKEKRERSINLLQNNLQSSIIHILHKLGVPSHIKGFQYIKEGILLLYEREEITAGNKIYSLIARKYHSSISKVERSIRHAIEISWNRGNWDLMEDLFGNSIDEEKAKPTNREFMITITERLRLDYFKQIDTK